jgi:hypothetical protein
MAKKKSEKHPKDMTNQELAEHVFHPKVLAHARKHIDKLNALKVPKEPKK